MTRASWRVRADMAEIDLKQRYAGHPSIFSIRLHHGGEFTKYPGRKYIKGKENFVDLLDIDKFSIHDLDDIVEYFDYVEDGKLMFYHFLMPLSSLDYGLYALASDQDVCHLAEYIPKHKLIDVYIEHGKTNLTTYMMSPNPPKVRIEEIIESGPSKPQPRCSRRLFLEWYETDIVVDSHPKGVDDSHSEAMLDKDKGKEVDDSHADEEFEQDNGKGVEESHADEEFEQDNGKGVEESQVDEGDVEFEQDNVDSDSDSDDSDFIVDEEDMLGDVDVNMDDFMANIDVDEEWIGDTSEPVIPEESQCEEPTVEVLNNDELVSGSSSDDGETNIRKKSIRKIQRAHANENATVSDPFYLFQTFSSAEEVKEKVKEHAIETRRELVFAKNDKTRVRVVCNGSNPTLVPGQKEVKNDFICPWVLLVSKCKRDTDWVVKTYRKVHQCLQTRKVKAYTYHFLAKQIVHQVEVNPEIPIRALQEELQRNYQLSISEMKVFRAKEEARKKIQGDYGGQYALLRDYAMELQQRNPGTTIKIDVETNCNPTSETRTFRRIYICLGALKKGFAAGKRDFLGLDGTFMKGPFPGQILVAVGLDGNNCIYPVAYAVVESENFKSWTWFLTCLGDDLDLHTMSNFTFITDRQKGVLPAIAKLFPVAEHRYCVKHIHENMKLQWRGKVYNDLLWNCAKSTCVNHFNQAMEKVKNLNSETYDWLKKIPPQHWTRSHFSGRPHCDALLNNMCESFNSKLSKARDKPIITCLEFIREYLMKRLVAVQKEIDKASGPLTPTATEWLETIKKEAAQYRAIFCGNGRYQVSAPCMDQCVVDVPAGTCSCNRWELTGIPCKHAIAAIWDMGRNNENVGIPETWVHQTYWLETWKEMYSFKIEPINGRSMWEKSLCPTTLLPPKHHVQVGRPKKKRKKSAMELQDMVKGDRVSRSQKSVTCSKCGNIGHNARSCKGQPTVRGGGRGRGGGASTGVGGGRRRGRSSGVGGSV
ncbi:hypothetical protein LXL04_013935 [Taraxacum kok-saghyz]